jgi:hypothetical protein
MTPRPLIAMADGPGAPGTDPIVIAALVGLEQPDLLLGWTVEDLRWLDLLPAGRAWSVSAGYRLDKAVVSGTGR